MKKLSFLIILTLMLTLLLPITVSADTGPKPSVNVTLENMTGEACYGTLLSSVESTGPSSAWDGKEEHAYHSGNVEGATDYKIWKAFVDFAERDGFYFLQHSVWRVDGANAIEWNYYPPSEFKILLYYPESEEFIVSTACERYAFDSYFTFDVASAERVSLENIGSGADARRSYDYTGEIASLVIRVLITVALEILIAIILGFRGRGALVFITITNLVTQILLNVLANFVKFASGTQAFYMGFIGLELLVFAIEAVLYALFLKRLCEYPKSETASVVYALVANLCSFIAGLALAVFIPQIF